MSLFKQLKEYKSFFESEISLIENFEKTPTFKSICDYCEGLHEFKDVSKNESMKKAHLFVKQFKEAGFYVEKESNYFLVCKEKQMKTGVITLVSQIDILRNGKEDKKMPISFFYQSETESFYFEIYKDYYFINTYKDPIVNDEIFQLIKDNFNLIGIAIKENEYTASYVNNKYQFAGVLEIKEKENIINFINYNDIDFVFNQKYTKLKNSITELKDFIDLNYTF